MANVNIKNDVYEDLEQAIVKAQDSLKNVEDVWGTNFDNLVNNYVDSGYLDGLYDDSISNYHTWKNSFTIVSCASSGAVLGCIFGPPGSVVGGIIGAIIGILFGGIMALLNEPTWLTVSKEAFIQLLLDCQAGRNDNYTQIVNIMVKMQHVLLNLEKIKTLVNDYQLKYADLKEAAGKAELDPSQLVVAGDGLTVTDITTSIDGYDGDVSISEAMNAFYTHVTTVTAASVEAGYLQEQYPDLDINWEDIIKNSNSFISDTLKNGLYSHEFIELMLPEWEKKYDEGAAKDSTSEISGFSMDALNKILDGVYGKDGVGQEVGMYAGLIGTTFLKGTEWPDELKPKKEEKKEEKPISQCTTTCSTTCSTSCSTSCGTSCSTSCSSDPHKEEEKKEEEKTENDVEIEKVTEVEVPEEELKPDYGEDVDYDKLAREQYEFGEEADKILDHQAELLDEIERAYQNGDLSALQEKLKGYGFSGPEVEAILGDKASAIETLMYCDKREILAEAAKKLAEADGVKDFDTKYDDKIDYDKEIAGDEPNDLLMLASEDETCVKAYEEMGKAKEAYDKALEEVNPLIKDANDKKKSMLDLKEKYEKEFKSEDTKKWSEAAAKEYNEAIKAYNTSVTEASSKMASVETAKTAYQEARTSFEEAEKTYYEEIKKGQSDDELTPMGEGETLSEIGSTETQTEEKKTEERRETQSTTGERTEITTDDLVIGTDGDITINGMSGTGAVAGATYETSVGTTDTGTVDHEILDGLQITEDGIKS